MENCGGKFEHYAVGNSGIDFTRTVTNSNGSCGGQATANDGDAAHLLNGLLDAAQLSKSTVTDRQDRIKDGVEIRRSNELNDTAENNSAAAATATSSSIGGVDKLNGGRSTGTSRVNNFSSYIPAKDYEKGDIDNRLEDNNDNRNDMSNLNKSRVIQDKSANNVSTTFLFLCFFCSPPLRCN